MPPLNQALPSDGGKQTAGVQFEDSEEVPHGLLLATLMTGTTLRTPGCIGTRQIVTQKWVRSAEMKKKIDFLAGLLELPRLAPALLSVSEDRFSAGSCPDIQNSQKNTSL